MKVQNKKIKDYDAQIKLEIPIAIFFSTGNL